MADHEKGVSVLLLDAFPVERWGLRAVLLGSDTGISRVDEALSIPDALERARETSPNVVLVGALIDGDPTDVVTALGSKGGAPVVALFDRYASGARSFLDAGGIGCVSIDCAPQEVIAAVRAAAAGNRWISANLTELVESYPSAWMRACSSGDSHG